MERGKNFFNKYKRHILRSALFLTTAFLMSPISDSHEPPAYAQTDGCRKRERLVNATWYDLHGNITATGDVMDRNALTAAVPEADWRLLRTSARVRFNGLSIIVYINDTGKMGQPPYEDYYLDLSREAANRLGIIDLGKSPVCLKTNVTPNSP